VILAAGPTQTDWPSFGLIDDIRPALNSILERGEIGALATLIDVDGPSPRPIGSQMVIAPDGAVAGYVSGGCVEGSIALLAKDVIESGTARRLVFGAGSPFFDVSLVCGSRIEVLLEIASPSDQSLMAVLEAWRARKPVERIVPPEGEAKVTAPRTTGECAGTDEDGAIWRRYDPATRVIVVGQDPVALALASLAQVSGYEVNLVRDRGPDEAPPGFGGRYLNAAPKDAIAELAPDAWTSVVTTTHDLDADHQVLVAALGSGASYVGALGSRRRLADRIAKLEAAGVSWDEIKRLRAPVGLDIGAATPFEIATSILADVIKMNRGTSR
jgi:xanthine dehydrogenase accessory factor